MAAYYNEFDLFAAEWLRNLIKSKYIADGEVDTRSISDVSAEDLQGFDQCHFFAGIGGWSRALRLARWPDDRPVWTGSCPCQPFSSAGNQKGKTDERHLWPVWESLIRECQPPVIFGEQVASAITHGWLDDVYQGLEAQDYAVGSAVLPACSVGAPHRRDRLFFVAHAESERKRRKQSDIHEAHGRQIGQGLQQSDSASEGIMADSNNQYGRQQHQQPSGKGARSRKESGWNGSDISNATGAGLPQRERETLGTPQGQPQSERQDSIGGKWWAVEPDVGRVAHGIRNRVGKLRGYGNAIVPQVAAEFIRASA